jgi:hypothetical protein
VLLDPPVPQLLAANFAIPGATVRMAESYDNGSSYLLVTTPRNENHDYTLSITKAGYTFNALTLVAHNITPRPAVFVGQSASFIIKDTTKIVAEAGADDIGAAKEAAEYLAGTLRKSTGYPVAVVDSGEVGLRDISLKIISKTQDLADGVNHAKATDDGYALVIGIDGARLTAYTKAGLLRGIRTMKQLLPAEITADALVADVNWVMTYATVVDYQGTQVVLSEKDGQVTADYTIYNTEAGRKIQLILAEYDGNGALKGVTQEEHTVAADPSEPATFSITIPSAGNQVKAYLWDADTYLPLCPAGN